jgi:hypothetical protein
LELAFLRDMLTDCYNNRLCLLRLLLFPNVDLGDLAKWQHLCHLGLFLVLYRIVETRRVFHALRLALFEARLIQMLQLKKMLDPALLD